MHPQPVPATGSRSGFTLIELLAVLMIISLLVAVLVTQLGGADALTKIQLTRQEMVGLEAAIAEYERMTGDYPPSSFTANQGVSNDGDNVGNEALVVALFSNDFEAGGVMSADELGNVDGDASTKRLTDFETRSLLEILDKFGNPLAYIHRTDYGEEDRAYLTRDPITDEFIESIPVAFKNPVTGRYYNHRSFQLISAGADGEFGTIDDITSFDVVRPQ